MPAYLSPLLNDQQADANGAPLSGGRIYTYKAGTSTPIATYTDADGLTPQSNPIVLNSAGRPDSPIWLPAGQAVKLVLKTSADVLVDDWDDVTGINDPSLSNAVDQWVTFSGTPTYISATSFSVQGDQTGVLQVGRRIKTSNTGGTIYSTITDSAYDPGSGLTTVTVANDSGTLDAGLSLVSYGLLSATNPSLPGSYAARAALGFVGSVINRAYGEYTANANLSTQIPSDDTIPQNTEGTQIISVTLTPKSVTSRIRLRFVGQVTSDTATVTVIAAIFSSASANALRAGYVTIPTAGHGMTLALEYEYVPGTISALTFSVRVGPATAVNVRMNGNAVGRLFGGSSVASLTVEEISVA